ncbi:MULTISPECIES: hypothetical protein [Variovorax]|uniref:hypothetical protein n=1 Tax=Variovorax TaxID=34072 RepID=UPI002855E546|nr:hypothetical protein [Variovorax sp. 3319]MDR6887898.1 hypothetical protein [Variovorax sp. 3319]
MALTQQELLEHLKRQLVFLKNSCAAFDSDDSGLEAIRIGVTLRVLFHDTGKSKSLLKQLGQKATLQVTTTARALPPNHNFDYAELLAGQNFGNTIRPTPVPPGSPTIAADAWWNEAIFFRDGVTFNRAQVALAAAHKDGGAHVDEADDDLKAFREHLWLLNTTNADGATTQVPLENNHFRMLRRLADELLNSPDLIALAT